MQTGASKPAMAKLKDKIENTLSEARIDPGFEKLSEHAKYMKLGGLGLTIPAILLLMWPGAFHQIAENGEDTRDVHRFASRMMLVSMIPLALGITGAFYVVARKTTDSVTFSVAVSIALLALFYGLWFGYTLYKRGANRSDSHGVQFNVSSLSKQG